MNVRAIWSFIAGDSRYAPLGVAVAVGGVLAVERFLPASGGWSGVLFTAAIAAGLVAGVFERCES